MADWSRLSRHLVAIDNEVTFTWQQLGQIVGHLPPSAARYRAWWSGERPHVRAWKSAGFRVAALEMGRQVTFERVPSHSSPEHSPRPTEPRHLAAPDSAGVDQTHAADLVLVSCVKTKRSVPSAAQDLYTSPLFVKARAYAEQTGAPWFILSAEHGLLAPTEWLSPYERYLPDTSGSYRAAWGAWVAARLELLAGPLRGARVEIHAGSAYIDAVRQHLEALGASVTDPLHGLTHGRRLAWYDQSRPSEPPVSSEPQAGASPEVATIVARLSDPSQSMSPAGFLSARGPELDRPGLYSWWVDKEGAADLAAGLGLPVAPGLIYAGLAGATRWPSGKRSANSLWGRITTMHLGGNHEFSTFRRTLASLLPAFRTPDGSVDESALTTWMHRHLRLIAAPFDDADTLGRLEGAVLDQLDPPLNLQGRPPTPVRRRLRELRSEIAKRS